MTAGNAPIYTMRVGILWWRKAAPALLFVFSCLTFVQTAALGEPTRIPTSASPVIFIQIVTGNLTLHTSDAMQVQVDADPGIESRHLAPQDVENRIPREVYLWSQSAQTPDGVTLRLEPETFLLPQIENGAHDAVVVRGNGNATITIPSATSLVIANVRRGEFAIEGYKNGVFVAHVANGAVMLDNVGGTGAVQINNGPLAARNSDFARLRVRTVRGNMHFENCNATQIEATSLTGTILYDNGTFAPGLARFESERGNVLLGVTGGVQVGAHSGIGQIFSDSAPVAQGQTDAQATMGRGGPVVTATSGSGSVVFYSGALHDHPAFQRRFANRFRKLQQKPPHDGDVHLKRMLQ